MSPEPVLDVLIIGAGFGGLRMLYEARQRGLSARVLEEANDVGGTWHWNRYPGARTDSESWVYCFAFDKKLMDDWDWPERYPSQPQVQGYLRHVADRFDMCGDIQLDTRVQSAVFDEGTDLWTVTTEAGTHRVCRTLVTAVGPLSAPKDPPFPGLADFRGEWYLTGRWPQDPVDFVGKRVAVIGTGASGIQVIPLVAAVADKLTVFQRTANYAIPARNYVLDDLQRQSIKSRYDQIWDQVGRQSTAMPINQANRVNEDVTPEEREKILQAAWEEGGFRYFLESFDDVFVNPESNAAVSEFVRKKIRVIVHDPATAELLCPKADHPLGAKRPPLANFYYETFNRDNVELVDVSANAIEDVTATGIRMADGTQFDFDVIVFATGFDAMTGALTRIDLRGKGGRSISERWQDGPCTHLSMAVDEFPNLFMISGPQIPFGNAPPIIEVAVEAIGEVISLCRDRNQSRVEVSAEAVQEYDALVRAYYDATIFPAGAKLRAWWLGTNVQGKALGVAMYFGGFPTWVAAIRAEAASGFEHYHFSSAVDAQTAPAAEQSGVRIDVTQPAAEGAQ